MDKILTKLQNKISNPENILTELNMLSNSELNSFLLELYRRKAEKLTPSFLLKQFKNNRFVIPSRTDAIKIKETEIDWLKYSKTKGFKPLNLSPLTPLGSCSVVGNVDQNNVVSALRGTEIVSDATNVLALKIAGEFKTRKDKKLILKYSTIHRHVRGQLFTNPNFTAHFSVFCLATGGFDSGNFEFEITQMNNHLITLFSILNKKFDTNDLKIILYSKTSSERFNSILKENFKHKFWKDKKIEFSQEHNNQYYNTLRFKIFLIRNEEEIDLADGGMVDWTQKLLGNKKHRLLTSGIGLELVEKI